MKYTIFLILLTLSTLSFIAPHRLRHKYRNKARFHLKTVAVADNILYQFLLGCVAELSGQPAFIDECSKQVPGWESAGVTEDKDVAAKKAESTDEVLKSEVPTWKKILGYLGTAINIVCTLKSKIIDFLTKKRRRWNRLFAQGQAKTKRFKFDFGKFISGAKQAFEDVGNAISKGAQKVKSAVVEGVDWAKKKASEISDFLKQKIQEKVKPVLELYEDIKAKFTNWLSKHPIMEKTFNFLKCIITNKGAQGIKAMVDAVKSLIALIPKLGSPAGWITLIVNLVCGWEDLRDGIQFLLSGMKETDRKKKYNFYGKFTGKLIKAIAG